MRSKDKLLEDLDWLTDKISSAVWKLSVGTLGTTWSLLIASGSIPERLRFGNREAYPILLLCILAMMFDMIQYLAAYRDADRIRRRIEASRLTEFEYDESTFLYKLRKWSFCIKIVLTVAGTIVLLVTLFRKLT
jgi:hypothetical protein